MEEKSIETGPSVSKFQVTIFFTMDDIFMTLVPSHRTYINYLINKGIIDTYTVSMESQRSWLIINAVDNCCACKSISLRFAFPQFLEHAGRITHLLFKCSDEARQTLIAGHQCNLVHGNVGFQ